MSSMPRCVKIGGLYHASQRLLQLAEQVGFLHDRYHPYYSSDGRPTGAGGWS
jgi:hypothetical protein